MRTNRQLQSKGIATRLGPVPRELSSSCGTCVSFNSTVEVMQLMPLLDEDFEAFYHLEGGSYRAIITQD